jgi:hypothetical protein
VPRSATNHVVEIVHISCRVQMLIETSPDLEITLAHARAERKQRNRGATKKYDRDVHGKTPMKLQRSSTALARECEAGAIG